MQLLPRSKREPVKQHFTAGRQLNQHLAMIFVAVPALECSAIDQAIDQLDAAVVAQAKLLRDCGHGRTDAARPALDGQQELALRFNSLGVGGFLAEVQEFPDTASELGKLAKTKFGYIRCNRIENVGVLTVSHRRKLLANCLFYSMRDSPALAV